jgi:hypothetical protein
MEDAPREDAELKQEAVGRRKDQLNAIKETLGVVQTLMKFQATLAEEFNIKKADEREGKGPNVLLFKKAGSLLKQAGK